MYNHRFSASRLPAKKRWVWPVATVFAALTALGSVVANAINDQRDASMQQTSPPQALTIPALPETVAIAHPVLQERSGPLPYDIEQTEQNVEPRGDDAAWTHETVKPRDTLSAIFKRAGIFSELEAALKAGPAARKLVRIHPGQVVSMRIVDGRLLELRSELSKLEALRIIRRDDLFHSEIEQRDTETRQAVATGTISHSLFLAGKAAGLSDRLIMELAAIFAWDVDFALDIREGDRFTVLYEETYLEGEKLRDGEIVAAEFINQGERHHAYRHTTTDGRTSYFSADGRDMRKQFIRTPVSIARISSGFNLRRKHPVLNRIRAHKGVDYAAPTGTPIKATGNGRVTFRGKKGGYGNTVIIQHGSTYTTLYAHMSRFARGIKSGSRVQQGQTIGYIGSTGLATGPHLHYEFRVNGQHRNPLTVKLPKSAPLPKNELPQFVAAIKPLQDQLKLFAGENVAHNASR